MFEKDEDFLGRFVTSDEASLESKEAYGEWTHAAYLKVGAYLRPSAGEILWSGFRDENRLLLTDCLGCKRTITSKYCANFFRKFLENLKKKRQASGQEKHWFRTTARRYLPTFNRRSHEGQRSQVH